jgi:3-oxoacyl-[acyl-carrier-protein] synthase III
LNDLQADGTSRARPPAGTKALVIASSAVFGSESVASEKRDAAFGMEIGKLRARAGIESVSVALDHEDEVSLATEALRRAMRRSQIAADRLECLIATSETHRRFPSLAAEVHSSLGLQPSSMALDVGGACLGLLHAFSVARSLLVGASGPVAIVTADVHSRLLLPGRVPGEFGGLFGDGASAFVLGSERGESALPEIYALGDFSFGAAPEFRNAIRVSSEPAEPQLEFDGAALSRAALTILGAALRETERRSGIPLSLVKRFATHQPNPRLVEVLRKQLGLNSQSFPSIARDHGNLGSTTCGAALHSALESPAFEKDRRGSKQAIFLASLAPGLLYGAGWLELQESSDRR